MADIILNGITWGHSRGITPLLAASQRFSELHPGIEIRWKKRTLQEFADYPIEKLTEQYDLLIIDHPWVGCAAATQCVLPLEKYLPETFLRDQQQHSVGGSHESYQYAGHQWALAIDAAAPAASYRKDLLEKNDCCRPKTWQEVLDLAERGKVAAPAIPIDLLMNFYSFCLAQGGELFSGQEEITDHSTAIAAIGTMQQLYSRLHESFFHRNPIAVAEIMAETDDYWYCPFAYPYSNYSRLGYARHLLHYAPVVAFQGKPLHTTIGGTGLSVSAVSAHQPEAIAFAEFVASGICQRTLYVQHGGQPGHRSAWTDPLANMLTNDFFKNVLAVMDSGYLRPRYNGYLHFQDHAGDPLRDCLMQKLDATTAINKMNHIYRQSLAIEKRRVTA